MPLSPAQLEQRKQGIGSSEIAAVAGLSPPTWDGPVAIWLEKTGQGQPKPSNDQTEMGSEVEPILCRWAIAQLGLPEALYGETRAHPNHPWALATPDWIVRKPRVILETKNIGYRMLHHWDLDADDDRGVPDYYLAQVQWQLEIWDHELAYVAGWFGGRDRRLFRIERDREVAQALLEVADYFWNHHVLKRIQPPVDGRTATDRWLADRFRAARDTVMVAGAEVEAAVAELRHARAAHADADLKRAIAEQRVKELMGPHTVLESSLGTITWRTDRWGRVAWKEVVKEAGDAIPRELIEKHRSPPGRRFLPPREWGGRIDE